MKVLNQCKAVVDARATRSLDGKITLGEVSVLFANDSVKFVVPEYIRESNLNEIQQMERIIHNYIGVDVTTLNLAALADELEPIATKLVIA
ncbi:hypothetical protein ZZ1p0101 [Acinetobacter phage ZZ1]|jgi:uridylate kinase|uniref:Uncharacterized protein n=3 Tax=Caudoviricetes TaxID=2731619 RepID=A0A410T5N0_9CAUD|nr:hypothetical protein ZZ1p0101 [Acinetobacter phage ZZ1]AFL47498.1 hypothetical protein ZZ1p0101 [Acinetobacter phage ZZ1]QAU03954.1 hypothetical protein Henu6_gp151 [Acinetobacter phage Henu6]